MSVSVRTRFEVFKRDRFTCAYCGRTPPDVLLECDHILPRAAGGSDDIENLITACWDCNHGKAARLLEEGSAPAISQRAVQDEQERLEQLRAYATAVQAQRELMAQFEDMVIEAWANAFGAFLHETKDGSVWRFGISGRFPSSATIQRVLKRLPVAEMLDAVAITASRFRSANSHAEFYFYKVCWNKVTEYEAS